MPRGRLTCQPRTDLSSEPENSRARSAENTSDVTPAVWPDSVRTAVPAAASHSFTCPSLPPVASHLPSGLTATAATLSGAAASSVNVRTLLGRLHSLIVR